MTEAVIVSPHARPLQVLARRFQHDPCATLGAHAVRHASPAPASTPRRSRTSSWAAPIRRRDRRNIARQIALRAGLPVTTAGITVNRFCRRPAIDRHGSAAHHGGEGGIYAAGGSSPSPASRTR